MLPHAIRAKRCAYFNKWMIFFYRNTPFATPCDEETLKAHVSAEATSRTLIENIPVIETMQIRYAIATLKVLDVCLIQMDSITDRKNKLPPYPKDHI